MFYPCVTPSCFGSRSTYEGDGRAIPHTPSDRLCTFRYQGYGRHVLTGPGSLYRQVRYVCPSICVGAVRLAPRSSHPVFGASEIFAVSQPASAHHPFQEARMAVSRNVNNVTGNIYLDKLLFTCLIAKQSTFFTQLMENRGMLLTIIRSIVEACVRLCVA